MTRPLSRQTVVITGASSGIGREAAVLLGQKGANVGLAARDGSALNEVASKIEGSNGRALIVVTDVADWPQVERLAHAAVDHFGRIESRVFARRMDRLITYEISYDPSETCDQNPSWVKAANSYRTDCLQ